MAATTRASAVDLTDDGQCKLHPEVGKLVDRLHELFAGDSVDVDDVRAALDCYRADDEHWRNFEFWDDHKYTRNLIDRGNGKFNLLLLCWNNGHASSIHDHAGAHCFMKIIDGELCEELFACPDDVVAGEKLDPLSTTTLGTQSVCYISDEIGLHRISNPSHARGAMSLHLYSPPFEFCKSYCPRSGNARASGKMTFTSERGSKTSLAM